MMVRRVGSGAGELSGFESSRPECVKKMIGQGPIPVAASTTREPEWEPLRVCDVGSVLFELGC